MAKRQWKSAFLFLVCIVVLAPWTMGPSKAYCEVEDPVDEGPSILNSGWSTYIQGGALHQFDADMDDGSRFSVNRYFVQGGVTYAVDPLKSVSLSLGYGLDSYDFSGIGGFAGFTYRINDRLTIGPGIGALRQIEDSSVFPVLLIDWKMRMEI